MADENQERLNSFLRQCRDNPELAEKLAKDPKGTLAEYNLSSEDLPEDVAEKINAAGLSGKASQAAVAGACG